MEDLELAGQAFFSYLDPNFAGWFSMDENLVIGDNSGLSVNLPNRQLFTILEITPSQWIGRKITDFIPLEEQAALKEDLKHIRDGNTLSVIIHKSLNFGTHTKEVAIIASRVPRATLSQNKENFRFFACQLTLATLIPDVAEPIDSLPTPQPRRSLMEDMFTFAEKHYGKVILVGGALGVAIKTVLDALK